MGSRGDGLDSQELDPNSPGAAARTSDTLLGFLRDAGVKSSVRSGQALFQQGDDADALYVVEDGLFEVSTLSEKGRKLTHAVFRPGSIFGEIAMFDGGPRTATATAIRDSVVYRVHRTTLMAGLTRDPDLVLGMIRLVINRMRWMSGQIEDHGFQPLEFRVCRRIEVLLRTMGQNSRIEISQSDLADHVGATREAVSKVVNDLSKDGILGLSRGQIVVRDPAALNRKIYAGLV